MNKLIEKLAEQAQKVVGHTDGGYTEIKVLDQEKFAELIVRECADTVLGFHNQFGDNAHNEIRQHFGVEE